MKFKRFLARLLICTLVFDTRTMANITATLSNASQSIDETTENFASSSEAEFVSDFFDDEDEDAVDMNNYEEEPEEDLVENTNEVNDDEEEVSTPSDVEEDEEIGEEAETEELEEEATPSEADEDVEEIEATPSEALALPLGTSSLNTPSFGAPSAYGVINLKSNFTGLSFSKVIYIVKELNLSIKTYSKTVHIDNMSIDKLDTEYIPINPGYYFKGFFDNDEGGTIEIYPDGTFRRSADEAFSSVGGYVDISYYAQWEPIILQTNITLNHDGGTGASIDQLSQIETGNVFEIHKESYPGEVFTQLTPPTKEGFVFGGYYKELGGTSIQFIDASGNKTSNWNYDNRFTSDGELKAKWLPQCYEVKLFTFSGLIQAGAVYEVYNTGWSLDPSGEPLLANDKLTTLLPTDSGKVFDGYWTQFSGGEKKIDKDGTILMSNTSLDESNPTISLFAHWKNIITVTLNPSPGSGGTITLYHKEGEGVFTDEACNDAFTGAITKPTRTGYVFKGYKYSGTEYIKADGTRNTTNWGDDAFDSISEDTVTLVAEWEQVICKVELYNEGTLFENLYEVYNAGWSLDSSGEPLLVNDKLTTLPTKTNYIFDGYWTLASGGDKKIDKDGTILMSKTSLNDTTATLTLHAHWKKRITVTLNPSPGSGGTTTLYHKEGEGAFTDEACTTAFSSSISLPVYANYNFDGYEYGGTEYIKADGTRNTTNWNNNAFSSVTGFSVTLIAKWNSKIYTVTLDNHGGTGQTHLYEVYNTGWSLDSSGEPLLVNDKLTTLPTKTNYIFDGYWTLASGGDKKIDKDGTILMSKTSLNDTTATLTLHAHWKKRITVTLNPSPGSGGTTTLYHKEGEGAFTDEACTIAFTGVITKPTRTGYVFKGYKYSGTEYIKADGTRNTTNWVDDAFNSISGVTVTLVADWDQAICKVELYNEGTLFENLYEVYNAGWSFDPTGTSLLSPAKLSTLPTKANHKFNGYYTSQTGGTQVVDKEGNILASTTSYNDPSATNKWYAQYIAIYNITLDDATNGMAGGSGMIYKLHDGGFYSDSFCTVSISTVSIPTKAGYTFKGYYDSASAGTQYIKTNGDVITSAFSNGNKVLYAQAELNSYIITYDIGLNADTSWSATAPARDASGHVVVNGSGNIPATFLDLSCATRLGSILVGWKLRTGSTVYSLGDTIPNTLSGNIILDAVWVISPYTVKYNLNGATGLTIPPDGSYTYPASVDEALPTFASGAWSGYNFAGWCHLQECTDDAITRSTEIDARYTDSSTNTVTLYAKWVKITHKLSFNMHGHGSSISDVDVWELEYPIKPTPDPSETSFIFDGWYTSDTYTTSYNFNHYLSADETAHAKWLAVYAIKLEKNDTTSTVVNTLYHKENVGPYVDESCTTAFIGPIAIPTRDDYTFIGFVENSDGTGAVYIKADGTKDTAWTSTAFTANKTIYAKWGANNYTILLDKNDGSGTLAGNIHEEYGIRFCDASSVTIANVSIPTRTGFIFDGYYSAASGGTQYIDKDGNIICPNTTFTANNVRIYAHWTKVYTINIDKNDGSGAVVKTLYHKTGADSYIVYEDASCTIAFNSITSVPTRVGYVFKGVVKNSNGTGAEYVKESGSKNDTNWTSTAFTSDATIYVKWEAKTYNLNLHINDGSYADGYSAPISRLYTQSINLPQSTNVNKVGYAFAGWYKDSGFNEGPVTTIPANTEENEYWLKWTEKEYNITYNLMGGTWITEPSADDKKRKYTESKTLAAAATFERHGYDFVGWYDNNTYSGSLYTQVVANTDDSKTFFAKWQLKTPNWYEISFDANGGSGTMYSQGVLNTETVALTSNAFVKNGYSFINWKDGSGTAYANGTSIDGSALTGNLVLKAQWKQNNSTSPSSSDSYGGGSSGGGGGGGGGNIKSTQNMEKGKFPNSLALSENFDLNYCYEGPITNNAIQVIENPTFITNSDGSISAMDKNGKLIDGFCIIRDEVNRPNYYFFTEEYRMYCGYVEDIQGNLYHFSLEDGMMDDSVSKQDLNAFNSAKELVKGQLVVKALKDTWTYDPIKGTWRFFKMTDDGIIGDVCFNGIYEIGNGDEKRTYRFDGECNLMLGPYEYLGQLILTSEEEKDKGAIVGAITLEGEIKKVEIQPTAKLKKSIIGIIN